MNIIVIGLFEKLVICVTYCTNKDLCMKLTDNTGCPKKTLVSVQRLLEALKSELEMKVG